MAISSPMSSTLAHTPYRGAGAVAMGKAGVEALLKALVPELGPHGIRVNVVAAGAVETEASAPYLQAHKEAISQALPLRRVAQPEDIAAAILLLVPAPGRLPDWQLPGCWRWQLLALMRTRRSAHFPRFFETRCTSHLLERERNFSSMQAIVIDPQAPVRLGFQTVEAPSATGQ